MLAFRPMLLTATLLLLAMNAEATIDLHLCPHSHLDVGFDWTPDVMFGRNGSENGVGKNKTRYQKSVGLVLEQAQKALLVDPARTYNLAEIFYIDLYLQQSNAAERAQLLQLVREGRLNFMNGGWCQNDEANVHVEGVVDQMTLGHVSEKCCCVLHCSRCCF